MSEDKKRVTPAEQKILQRAFVKVQRLSAPLDEAKAELSQIIDDLSEDYGGRIIEVDKDRVITFAEPEVKHPLEIVEPTPVTENASE